MGKFLSQNRICKFFFWIKFCFALLLALGGLGFLVYRVISIYKSAMEERALNNPLGQPIDIDPNSEACWHRTTGRSRVEPPDGVLLAGFHLNWANQTPPQIVHLLGNDLRPSV